MAFKHTDYIISVWHDFYRPNMLTLWWFLYSRSNFSATNYKSIDIWIKLYTEVNFLMVKMRGFVNLKLPQYKYKNIPDWFYSQVCLNCTLSAFFSVIWLAKCCRSLSLALFAHTYNDENDYSHNVREHFENLLHASWKPWDIEIHPVQNTE